MITSFVVGLAWGGFAGKCGWSFWYTVGTFIPVYGALKLATYALTGAVTWP